MNVPVLTARPPWIIRAPDVLTITVHRHESGSLPSAPTRVEDASGGPRGLPSSRLGFEVAHLLC